MFYWFFLWKTTKGFEMRVVGLNPTAGAYAGMSISRSSLLAMLLAGGFAGLGGCVEIVAVQFRLMLTSFSVSYGFTGIAVALMGNNNPVGIFLSGILFGGLQNGSLKMQTLTDVSASVVLVVQALIILFIAGRTMFKARKTAKVAVNVKGPSDPTKPILDARGDSIMNIAISFLSSVIMLSTPTLIAGLGIVFSERAGIVNIGTEGVMLVGALAGVIGSMLTGSVWLGCLFAMLMAMAFAAIFALFTVIIKADQTVIGTGMNILASGVDHHGQPRGVFGASTSPPKHRCVCENAHTAAVRHSP